MSVQPTEEELGPTAPLPMEWGAVTFLDVLGWKGIWLRRSHNETVKMLQALVGVAEAAARELRGSETAVDVRVISISDTIVLLSGGEAPSALSAHGMICQQLIPESVRRGIPLRGATTYGQFFASDGSILVGPAVDEAAAWHEALDWIGVILAPSAEYRWPPDGVWRKYSRAPVKSLGPREMFAVDWSNSLGGIEELRKIFSNSGPMDPTVAPKYMNTLTFISEMLPKPQT